MTEIEIIFAIPAALLAVATIVAKTRGARRLVLVVKPLATAAVFAMYAMEGMHADRRASWLLVGAGLVFSVVGDVLLELETDRFVAGLASFLVAHLCYLTAFATRATTSHGASWRPALWIALAALVAYAAAMLRALDPSLGPLRAPVRAYVAVIVLMAWAAVAWFLLEPSTTSALALNGAIFFFASDSLLAFDRFRSPLPHVHALVLSTYYVAQFLIAASAR